MRKLYSISPRTLLIIFKSLVSPASSGYNNSFHLKLDFFQKNLWPAVTVGYSGDIKKQILSGIRLVSPQIQLSYGKRYQTSIVNRYTKLDIVLTLVVCVCFLRNMLHFVRRSLYSVFNCHIRRQIKLNWAWASWENTRSNITLETCVIIYVTEVKMLNQLPFFSAITHFLSMRTVFF